MRMAMSVRNMCLFYDEEFNRKIKIAKFLVKNLPEKKEMQLANKWLVRVSNIKSPVLEVKKNRNAFLSYMVKVLGDGVLTGCIDTDGDTTTICDPDESLAFLQNPCQSDLSSPSESADEAQPDKPESIKKMHFHSRWSNDHKTYVAVKPIPGRGALVYLASSKKPGLHNWDLPTKKKRKNGDE